MIKIVFDGWDIGMSKISFIFLLKEKAGLTLSEAKKIKEKLFIYPNTAEVFVENEDIAKDILKDSLMLGVKGRIEIL